MELEMKKKKKKNIAEILQENWLYTCGAATNNIQRGKKNKLNRVNSALEQVNKVHVYWIHELGSGYSTT